MTNDDLEDLFLKEKPCKILTGLYRNKMAYSDGSMSGSALQSRIDSTYTHTIKTIGRLEKHGLVERERQGQKKPVDLTNAGTELAETLVEFEDKSAEVEEFNDSV